MKRLLCSLLLSALLPLTAAARASFGVVVTDTVPQIQTSLPFQGGAVVDSVMPGSPAAKAGIKPGCIITEVGGKQVFGRDSLAAILAAATPGDSLRVVWYVDGTSRSATVRMAKAPAAKGATTPASAVRGDRVMRPVTVSPAIRAAMQEHRAAICERLAALPEPFNPTAVTDDLQAIRDLARDANNRDNSSWMGGRAGESAVQFTDAEGSLQLRGASNSLTLEAYDQAGRCVFSGKLDTPAQRAAIPPPVLERLRRLK